MKGECDVKKGYVLLLTGMVAGSVCAQTAPAPAPVAGWYDSVKVKGDVRVRYEDIQEEKPDGTKVTDRQRDRYRVRLGAEAKVNANTKAVVGLSTTEDKDPVSSNQTMTDSASRKPAYFELAYIDWKLTDPAAEYTYASLLGGKMKNPFINVGDLVWDTDVNPEGAALNTSVGNEKVQFLLNGGYLWLKEYTSWLTDDIKLYAGQGAIRVDVMPELQFTVGGTYYSYDDLDGAMVKELNYKAEEKAFGNSTRKDVVDGKTTNVLYATGYNVAEAFVEVNAHVGIPVRLSAQYVVNNDADDYNTGYLLGAAIGKAKNPRTYELAYTYAELEKDAVMGALTDSDRWGGGTDGKGHKIGGKYQINNNLQLGASYFINDKAISDATKATDYNRVQVDLVASF